MFVWRFSLLFQHLKTKSRRCTTKHVMGLREEVRNSWLQRFEVLAAEKEEPPVEKPADRQDVQNIEKSTQFRSVHEIIDLSDEDDDIVTVSSPQKTHSKNTHTPVQRKKRPRSPVAPYQVIDLDDEPSDEDLAIVIESKKRKFTSPPLEAVANMRLSTPLGPPRNASDLPKPPFKPFHNRAYDATKIQYSITLADIVGSSNITKSYLFSFQYDMQYILDRYIAKDADIMVLYQAGTLLDCPLRAERNVTISEVQMEPYTSHHPKMIINFYKDNTMKIYLLSCNLIPSELEMNNQMYWESPSILLSTRSLPIGPKQPFQKHLMEYLNGYNKSSEPKLKELLDLIPKYDFSQVKGDFISSVKGSSGDFGYMALFKSLKAQGCIPDEWSTSRQLLYQTSSIAAPNKWTGDKASNIFTHLIAPLILGHFGTNPSPSRIQIPGGEESLKGFQKETNSRLLVVFPTVDAIENSKFGIHSGGWSHYNPFSKTGALQAGFLRSIFYKNDSKQRGTNTSHTKFLMMSSDNFKTLDWVLFTSHNMSKQAWGSTPRRGSTFEIPIKNYETGILITRRDYEGKKLIPLEIGETNKLKDDELPIYLPFRVPPEKYGPNDEPWCYQKFHAEANADGAEH